MDGEEDLLGNIKDVPSSKSTSQPSSNFTDKQSDLSDMTFCITSYLKEAMKVSNEKLLQQILK